MRPNCCDLGESALCCSEGCAANAEEHAQQDAFEAWVLDDGVWGPDDRALMFRAWCAALAHAEKTREESA